MASGLDEVFPQREFVLPVRDGTNSLFIIIAEASQGFPLSATLLNIFINLLARKTDCSISTSSAALYAGDVILRALTAEGLRYLLDIETE